MTAPVLTFFHRSRRCDHSE